MCTETSEANRKSSLDTSFSECLEKDSPICAVPMHCFPQLHAHKQTFVTAVSFWTSGEMLRPSSRSPTMLGIVHSGFLQPLTQSHDSRGAISDNLNIRYWLTTYFCFWSAINHAIVSMVYILIIFVDATKIRQIKQWLHACVYFTKQIHRAKNVCQGKKNGPIFARFSFVKVDMHKPV